MDRETKVFFLTITAALAIIWLTRPKLKQDPALDASDFKYKAPEEATPKDTKQREDAIVAMQAMKDAIAAKESKKSLAKLAAVIYQDYGIKIMVNQKNQKLRALTKEGKIIAEEQ